MNPILIIYDSKYGSTEETAGLLARVLGPATLIRPSDFNESYEETKAVVIGSPVYGEKIMPSIKDFIEKHVEWLKMRKVALFTVSISPKKEYVEQMKGLLGDCVVWQQCFGGVMDPEDWDEDDSSAMERFAAKIGHGFARVDKRDAAFTAENALELRHIFTGQGNCSTEIKKEMIEAFIKGHNTCALATAGSAGPRVTPIEYTFMDGNMYFLSEGGEKFANLSVDDRVSIAIYEQYSGFDDLAGLQITGKASIISSENDEYRKLIEAKGLDYDQMMALPVRLNLLRVDVIKYEALMSEFAKKGFDAKQVLEAGAK